MSGPEEQGIVRSWSSSEDDSQGCGSGCGKLKQSGGTSQH